MAIRGGAGVTLAEVVLMVGFAAGALFSAFSVPRHGESAAVGAATPAVPAAGQQSPQKSPVQQECERQIVESVKRGAPIDTKYVTPLPSQGSFKDPNFCVSVRLNPDASDPACKTVAGSRKVNCYQCVGKRVMIRQEGGGSAYPFRATATLSEAVQVGTCQAVVCTQVNGTPQCAAPTYTSFADLAFPSGASQGDVQGLGALPTLPQIPGGGAGGSASNTSAPASQGMSDLSSYIQEKYAVQCAGGPDAGCYVSVPQELVQQAGFQCNHTSWFSSDCSVEAQTALKKIADIKSGGTGIEQSGFFARTSGITATPQLLSSLRTNAVYLALPGSAVIQSSSLNSLLNTRALIAQQKAIDTAFDNPGSRVEWSAGDQSGVIQSEGVAQPSNAPLNSTFSSGGGSVSQSGRVLLVRSAKECRGRGASVISTSPLVFLCLY